MSSDNINVSSSFCNRSGLRPGFLEGNLKPGFLKPGFCELEDNSKIVTINATEEVVFPMSVECNRVSNYDTQVFESEKNAIPYSGPVNINQVNVVNMPINMQTSIPNRIQDDVSLKQDDSSEMQMGNFDVVLKGEEHYVFRTGKTEVNYIFDIILPKAENCCYNVRIPGDRVQKVDWIKDKSHGKVLFSGKKAEEEIRMKLVNLISSSLNRKIIYHNSGWQKIHENLTLYLVHDGPVGNSILYPGLLANPNKKLSYDHRLIGSVETFKRVLDMVEITKDPKASLPLLLFLHMGVMCSVFKEARVPIKFLMAYIGETNSKKTSIAKVLTQIFNVNENQDVVSFTSKECGLEEFCASQSDSIALIDDFRPSNSKEKIRDMQHGLEYLQRSYGDGHVKKRMTAFQQPGIESEFPPQGCCLITGECIPGVLSSFTRTVIVSTDKNQCINENLLWYQRNFSVLPSHIYDFLTFITENYEKVKGYIENNVTSIRSETSGTFQYERFSEYYAQFCVTIDLIFWYATNRGFLSEDSSLYYKKEFKQIVFELLVANELNLRQANPDDVFIVKLYEYLNDEMTNIVNVENAWSTKANIYASDSMFYLKSDVVIKIAERVYGNSAMMPSTKELLSKLAIQELIFTRDESGNTRRAHKIPRAIAKNERYIWIFKDRLGAFVENKTMEYDY